MIDIITITFTLAVVWAAYVLGYSRGTGKGFTAAYGKLGHQLTQWVDTVSEINKRRTDDELAKQDWSQCQ
jgi:hypothetical protein